LIIRIPNTIRMVNLIFEYSFVLVNMLIGLNKATILAFAASHSECQCVNYDSPMGMQRRRCIDCSGGSNVPLIVSHALSVSVRRSNHVILIIITLLFGAQQSVLGTPCLDSPKCMVLCLQSNAVKCGYLKETNSQ